MPNPRQFVLMAILALVGGTVILSAARADAVTRMWNAGDGKRRKRREGAGHVFVNELLEATKPSQEFEAGLPFSRVGCLIYGLRNRGHPSGRYEWPAADPPEQSVAQRWLGDRTPG
jgi:hypothetical protein